MITNDRHARLFYVKRGAAIIKNNEDKLIKYTIVGMAICIILICIISVFFVRSASKNLHIEKVQYLTEISSKSANLLETKIHNRLRNLEIISEFIGEDETITINKYMPFITQELNENQFKRVGIISLQGKVTTTDGYTYDLSDSDYFKKALAGQSSVSDMIIDKVDGLEINVFATPIKNKDKIVAVLFATNNITDFTQMVSIETFGNEGYSYVIKKNGAPVIHTLHKNSVGKYDNLFDVLKTVTKDISLVEKVKTNLQQNKDGNFNYKHNGVSKHVNYTKVNVNDWYMVSVVPTAAIAKSSDKLINNIVATAVLILMFTIFLSYLLIDFLKNNNKKLQVIAFTDNVTGYSNWNKFEIDCATLLKRSTDKKYAMVNFDIDKFKILNDIYGHKKGNDILQRIADILMQTTNQFETFARISADNFSVFMTYEINNDIISKINAIKKQVITCIEGYNIKLSFGIYKIQTKIYDISAISDRANLARLSIKGQSDSDFSFYNEEIRKSFLIENEIENCMEFALKVHEFEVYLQPKFLFTTQKIVGAEALVRWNRPEIGLVSPASFIPLFEKNGFVRKLDEYMFEQVCILINKWESANKSTTPIAISVNFSRMHLTNALLPEDLLSIAKRYNVNPKWIEIEITESAVLDNTQRLIKVMKDLKNVGFSVSIDDFGSGYSSLNILKDLPANVIKMDKELINESTDNERGKMIVLSLINMTKGLGLSTVAEGVETIEQVNFLKNAGCDIAQGFYYAKPMPIKDFEELLNNQKSECLIC